jgi:hypothetical protein
LDTAFNVRGRSADTEAEMSVVALRLDGKRTSVEVLLARIEGLAKERQNLRGRRASRPALERNRLALVRLQWELSYALIERHLPRATRHAA